MNESFLCSRFGRKKTEGASFHEKDEQLKTVQEVYTTQEPAGKRGLNPGTFNENYICKTVKKREKG